MIRHYIVAPGQLRLQLLRHARMLQADGSPAPPYLARLFTEAAEWCATKVSKGITRGRGGHDVQAAALTPGSSTLYRRDQQSRWNSTWLTYVQHYAGQQLSLPYIKRTMEEMGWKEQMGIGDWPEPVRRKWTRQVESNLPRLLRITPEVVTVGANDEGEDLLQMPRSVPRQHFEAEQLRIAWGATLARLSGREVTQVEAADSLPQALVTSRVELKPDEDPSLTAEDSAALAPALLTLVRMSGVQIREDSRLRFPLSRVDTVRRKRWPIVRQAI